MEARLAAIYVIAAKDNALLAAWISVLDEHKLSGATDVPPDDWWDAFQVFYNLGFVPDREFNKINTTKAFTVIPPRRDVEDALYALAVLRHQEVPMSKPFNVFENGGAGTPGLTHRNGNGAIEAPRSGGALAPRSVPRDILGPRAENKVARRMSFSPAATRMAPSGVREMLPTTRGGIRGLPDHGDADGEIDPGLYMKDWAPQALCCGQSLELIYDDGRDMAEDMASFGQDGEPNIGGPRFIELVFHTLCPHCTTEGHHSFIRRFPAE